MKRALARIPVTLSAMGSFPVGGGRLRVSGEPEQVVALSEDLPEYVVDPNGTYYLNHAYAQYFIPSGQRRLPSSWCMAAV